VSLLMDALRRAEEAKRLATPNSPPEATAAPGDLSLAPLEATARPRARSVPPLAGQRDWLDAERTAEASAPPSRAVAAEATAADSGLLRDAAERTAARNVFAVKQPAQTRRSLWLFLALGGIATLALGGYFWWQLQSLSSGSLARSTAPAPPANPSPAPRTTALPASPPPPQPSSLTAAEPQPAVVTPAEAPLPPPRAEAAQRAPERPRSAPTSTQPGEAAGVFRTGHRAKHEQTLNQAYEAFHADRLDDARRGYEQVLRNDPRNADALLGLAAIAARQGQFERSQDLYLRVLEADPGDITAQAALISLRGSSDAGQSESRLKTLLGGQPDSSPLHFALGNLYARQGRWSEAQQAYFEAYAHDPDNGDYLFNVAVSLDHLRQSKLAAQYYRMALSATRRSTFDRNAATQRLVDLQP
jgi:tetratricopeptide (TPR) repeat protein